MAECRFFPECQRYNETGDSWIPCMGGADGMQCEGYEPMPDVKGLLALADEMQSQANLQLLWTIGYVDVGYLVYYARRIREALGVDDGR